MTAPGPRYAHTLLAFLWISTGCSSTSYWLKHPDRVSISTIQFTSEPIFDSIRTPTQPAARYVIEIRVQNDGGKKIKFAKHANGAWAGAGLRAHVAVRLAAPVAAVAVDYSRLSERTVWAGDDSRNEGYIAVQVAPTNDSFVLNQLKSVGAAIDVTFTLHDKTGTAMPFPKTARIATELVLVGKIAPRRSAVVAR
jgi:hypothetical protein